MKPFLRAVFVLVFCLTAGTLFAADCSNIGKDIEVNRNNPKELRKLLQSNPQCGEIYEALGDYFYEKKVWNEAYANYEQAKKFSPDKPKLTARLQELRPKTTEMIKDERDLLAYKRSIGGTTVAGPGSVSGGAPSAAGGAEAPLMMASNPKSPPHSASSRKTADRSEVANQTAKASKSSARAEAETKKVGLVVLFDFNRAEIKPEGKELLKGFAQMLNTELAGKKYVVCGHTDDVGSPAYNLQLSEDRAKSVKSYLVSIGVDAARLKIRGYGLQKPIYDNGTEEGRAKNRRVEFVAK